MKERNKFNTSQRPVVLISPLDWGLGHATRCIPLIRQFKNKGCTVIVGAGKHTYKLLKQEFPELKFLTFPDYEIRYAGNQLMLIPVLLLQIPKVIQRMRAERKLLGKYIDTYNISIVISDNRFGLHSPKAYCVYMTHQLTILTPNRLITKIASSIHSGFIKRFNLCWVPDFAKNRLAGKMSASKVGNPQVQYMGPLSRFKKLPESIKYKICISISGPEPQRTLLENNLLKQIASVSEPVILIRGLPAQQEPLSHNNSYLQVHNHLPAAELNFVFEQSEIILSRSGYTTIMDLIQLGKKAILIPTPGQFEQEYLAKTLQQKKYFLYRQQHNFSLTEALSAFKKFSFTPLPQPTENYKKVIDNLIEKVST